MMMCLREMTYRKRMPASRGDLRTPHRFALARIRFAMCLSLLITPTHPEMVVLNSGLFVEVKPSSLLSNTISAIIDSSLLVSTLGIPNLKFNSHLEPDR
jgi:hypothetical protein